MLPLSSLRAYLSIRPRGFSDAVRLYLAYAASILVKAVLPSRFQSVGLFVRGPGNLGVVIDGIRFEVRPRTNDLDLLSTKHEPLTKQWFQVGPDDVVVDVGAHIGRYALPAAKKGAKVIAVEPEPSNFLLLQKNVILNGLSNVVLVPRAMTSSPRLLLLSLAESTNTGISSVKEDDPDAPPISLAGRWVRVLGETLDQLVDAHGLHRIDWLKIDVEGHEVAVLEGGSSALEMTRRLVLEVSELTTESCKRIVEEVGFRLISVEAGDPASNWLLFRDGS